MAEYPAPQDVLDRVVERLRTEEPALRAVLLGGSFARGEGDEYSDIDLLGRTDGEPRVDFRTWFLAASTGRVFQLSIEMEPLAPPRFSTTKGWPKRDCRRSAKGRAMTSFDPPGGKGTTTRTGRVGQSPWARAMARCSSWCPCAGRPPRPWLVR